MESTFSWEGVGEAHSVKRYGFMLTHAHYLTATASQGQTIRAAVTIDCARIEPKYLVFPFDLKRILSWRGRGFLL